MSWYLLALKNYATFRGRTPRSGYWYFILFNVLIGIALGFIDFFMGNINPETGRGLLGAIYSLAVLIPSISVFVRRLHDTNRSGWWFFLLLIPVIGWIVLFVFMVLRSDPQSNKYGEVVSNTD